MAGTQIERGSDLLDIIGQHSLNQGIKGAKRTMDGIRMILEGRGIVVPTLDDITHLVTQTPTLVVKQAELPVDLFARIYPEISLPEEHQRQGLVLAGRFAARLGLSHEAYIATLPEFPEKPSTYDRLGLKVPVIFETRVPWLEAAELSGIFVTDYMREQMSVGKIEDWEGINFGMPKVPFTAWVQDGTKFVFRKPSEVRKELGKKENKEYVAGSILPVVSMYDVRPDMVRTMFWDVVGTGVGSDRVPYLSHWGDGPGLDADRVGGAGPHFRAFVFGREIRTLNLAA